MSKQVQGCGLCLNTPDVRSQDILTSAAPHFQTELDRTGLMQYKKYKYTNLNELENIC